MVKFERQKFEQVQKVNKSHAKKLHSMSFKSWMRHKDKWNYQTKVIGCILRASSQNFVYLGRIELCIVEILKYVLFCAVFDESLVRGWHFANSHHLDNQDGDLLLHRYRDHNDGCLISCWGGRDEIIRALSFISFWKCFLLHNILLPAVGKYCLQIFVCGTFGWEFSIL